MNMKTSFTHRFFSRAFFFLALAAGTSGILPGQTTHTVNVTNNVYTPAEISIQVGDTVLWTNTQGFHNVNGSQSVFPDNPESFGNSTGSGWEYSHVFTLPGNYDYQCDPHVQFNMFGKVEVRDAESSLTVNLSGMAPHAGQEMYFALVESESGEIVDRVSETAQENFSVMLEHLESGKSYHLDFFSDHNGNGYYDAPPADHAWRVDLPDVQGPETVDFVHNTTFTDIMWRHRLRVRFEGMTPHAGQMLTLYVRDLVSGDYLDTVMVSPVEEKFDVKSYVLEPMGTYRIDFYSDHNGNGSYDPPPTDHAWRIDTDQAMGDLDIDFTHNTSFTDIFATTGLSVEDGREAVSLYPNPVNDMLNIRAEGEILAVTVYRVNGSGVISVSRPGSTSLTLPVHELESGLYIVEVLSGDNQLHRSKLLKQ